MVAVVPIPSFATSGAFLIIVPSMLSPMMEMLFPLTLVRQVSPRSYVPFGTKIFVRESSVACELAISRTASRLLASPAFTMKYPLSPFLMSEFTSFIIVTLWIYVVPLNDKVRVVASPVYSNNPLCPSV